MSSCSYSSAEALICIIFIADAFFFFFFFLVHFSLNQLKDTVEVDYNVTRHLEAELAANDWSLLVPVDITFASLDTFSLKLLLVNSCLLIKID